VQTYGSVVRGVSLANEGACGCVGMYVEAGAGFSRTEKEEEDPSARTN
jgi:hypothetical protein